MNVNDFFKELCNKLEHFRLHDLIISELLEAMRMSGNESSFIARLVYLLDVLNTYSIMATQHKQFELLGNGVYGMRLKNGCYNIRILYMFAQDKSPVLLHAFYERAGHGKTNYTGKIELARQRFTELKEEQ